VGRITVHGSTEAGVGPSGFIGVPNMFDSLGVQVLFTTRWT
jgi:hypothetical protein